LPAAMDEVLKRMLPLAPEVTHGWAQGAGELGEGLQPFDWVGVAARVVADAVGLAVGESGDVEVGLSRGSLPEHRSVEAASARPWRRLGQPSADVVTTWSRRKRS
jgi:hypothetical protein